MSIDAPTWFVEQYNNGVIQKYQSGGFLMQSTVSAAASIVGTKAYFNIMGKGKAHKKQRGQAAIPMNAKKGREETNLVTWEAFDEVYTYDLSRMSANEKEALTESGAKALGRSTDDELFQLFDSKASNSAGTGAGVKPNLDSNGLPGLVGGAGTDFELKHLLLMCNALQEADVPWDGNIFCPLPSIIWNQAMAYKQFNSSDWTGQDLSFTKATVSKFWNGVHFFLAPNEHFIQNEADHYDITMYHRGSAGWANNKKLQTIWDWDNRLGCWTVRMESEGAAAGLLAEGMVRGRFNAAADITLN